MMINYFHLNVAKYGPYQASFDNIDRMFKLSYLNFEFLMSSFLLPFRLHSVVLLVKVKACLLSSRWLVNSTSASLVLAVVIFIQK